MGIMKNQTQIRLSAMTVGFIIVFNAVLLSPTIADAAESQTAESTAVFKPRVRRDLNPSLVRMSFLAGRGSVTSETNHSNRDFDEKGATQAGALLGLGDGVFSAEVGATYLKLAFPLKLKDSNGNSQMALTGAEYVAVPIWAKYNYIESPLSTFFVKLGGMPAFLTWSSARNATFSDATAKRPLMANYEIFAVAGLGGTTPLSKSTAFILDLSYFYDVTEPVTGSNLHPSFASLNIGFSVEL